MIMTTTMITKTIMMTMTTIMMITKDMITVMHMTPTSSALISEAFCRPATRPMTV